MTIKLSDKAKKLLEKIDKPMAKKITSYLYELSKLADPRTREKGLTADKSGLWRYRVGDYRIVCEIIDDVMLIMVLKIGHRKNIYL